MPDSVRINGKTYELKETLEPWQERKSQAEKVKKDFSPQVKINRKFAAGKQHLNVNHRDGRVIDVRERNGIKMVTADILTPFLLTVLGRLSGTDYKSNFLVSQDNELAEVVANQMNMAYTWGWDNEWMGDKKVASLLRYLAVDGTVGVRVRYDRRFGDIIGEFPHKNGVPLFDKEARDYVADEAKEGRTAEYKLMREGKVVMEIIPFENLFWPPGVEDPDDFPYDLIGRPVAIKDIEARYPHVKGELMEEKIESSESLTAGLGVTEGSTVHLPGRAMVYTGYIRPNSEHPNGCTTVFVDGDAGSHLLDYRDRLPFDEHPRGPRTGIHYFRWQVLPGRFPGKAFLDNGIGPQVIRNKRYTQIDTIIDRNLPKIFAETDSIPMPKTGEPNEVIPVRPGSPLPRVEQGVPPGAWMLQDLKFLEEAAEKALGLAPVTRGNPPQGVSAYSALALLTENDALKLDPVAEGVRMGMVEVSWDLMESMRNWLPDKHILIAGPEDQLQSFYFNKNQIPMQYLVRPPRGGSLPRTQASELQKIDDIWTAAQGTLPLTWYVESKNQGRAQDLPPSLADAHKHKAELENALIMSGGDVPPVAEYDDHAGHAQTHRAAMVEVSAMADQGDEFAMQILQVFEMHLQMHEQAAESNRAVLDAEGIAPPQAGPPGGPGGAPSDNAMNPAGAIPRLPNVSSPGSPGTPSV